MPLLVTCPGCKSALRVKDEFAGKKLKCPRCASTISVTAPHPEAPAKPKAGPDPEIVEITASPKVKAEAPAKPRPKPKPEEAEVAEIAEVVDEPDPAPRKAITAAPKKPLAKKAIVEDEEYEDESPRGKTRKCPECGERISLTAERCRYCKAWISDEEGEEEEDDRPRRKGTGKGFKPCPRCGARGATRVKWTPWGSFYGPAMFTHVRCPECGYAYNGKTGRSNLIWAILFVSVALLLVAGLIGLIVYMFWKQGYFGGKA
jgi:predicted Zn finger-like uncharacterized protein